MLTPENVVLLVVDFQEKLVRAMHEKQALVENAAKMVQGAKILGLPILWTEQNPQGLGATVPEVADLLSDMQPVSKLSFSCCGEERFMEQLLKLNRKQALVCGIESHVCVYQSSRGPAALGVRGASGHGRSLLQDFGQQGHWPGEVQRAWRFPDQH